MKFQNLRTSRASLLVIACLSLAAMLISAAPQAFAQIAPPVHHDPVQSSHPATKPAAHPTPVVTPEGTWTPLVNQVPENVGLMMLLTDGTVVASGNNGTNSGTGGDNTWYKLTPDSKGSYVNGTWSQLSSMQYARLYVLSQILQNGKIFIAGGEYGNAPKGSGEIYDPIANTWTALPNTTTLEPNASYVDGESMLLPNGSVLAYSVGGQNCSAGGYYTGDLFIYDPVANSFSTTGCPIGNQDETSWVKLPDNSILSLDLNTNGNATPGPTSERYIPSTGQWIADAVPPVYLYNAGGELGGAFVLPNGNVFYIGGTNQTLIYTPSGTTAPGTWTQGPTFPNEGGAPVGANDAPAAMMVNGKIIIGEGGYVNPPCDYCAPTYFFVYDYQSNTISSINAPDGTASDNTAPFQADMLDLPDGSVLYEGNSTQLYTFKPASAQISAGEPVLTSVQANQDGSYLLTGTGFNGISSGADYGDENQNATNYPIAVLTDSNGNVYYGRTTSWSNTGVATGNATVTANMTVPAGLPDNTYTLTVVANGISSDPTQAASVFCYFCGATATPVFTPPGGNYTSAQSVKITDSTTGAVIYYTTDGSTPTTSSTKYTTPINVTATETINAIAVASSTQSTVASATYTITTSGPVATPIFNPASGTFTTAHAVAITDATTGVSIYYTTNGTTPTTSSTKYSGSVTVSKNETIKAIAVSGSTKSSVASATYQITKTVPAPTFTPAAGTYTKTQSVTITDFTRGATIYYTTNGSTPTTSSTKYTGAITVSSTKTIKALGVASGYGNSPIATATYTIK